MNNVTALQLKGITKFLSSKDFPSLHYAKVDDNNVRIVTGDLSHVIFPRSKFAIMSRDQLPNGLWKASALIDGIKIKNEKEDAEENFPEPPGGLTAMETFTLKPEEISGMENYAAKDMIRVSLKCISIHDGKAVATDGHKMLVRNVSDKTATVIIKPEQYKIFHQLFKQCETVTVKHYVKYADAPEKPPKDYKPVVSNDFYEMTADDVTFVMYNNLLQDSPYPNWIEAIPKDERLHAPVEVATSDLLKITTAFDKVIKANEQKREHAQVYFTGNTVAYLTTKYTTGKETARLVFAKDIVPKDFVCSFSLEQLSLALTEAKRHMKATVKINLSPIGASLIEYGDTTTLIMPLRISAYEDEDSNEENKDKNLLQGLIDRCNNASVVDVKTVSVAAKKVVTSTARAESNTALLEKLAETERNLELARQEIVRLNTVITDMTRQSTKIYYATHAQIRLLHRLNGKAYADLAKLTVEEARKEITRLTFERQRNQSLPESEREEATTIAEVETARDTQKGLVKA